MKNGKLIDVAKEYLKNSYSPYSNFKVGSALLLEDGSIVGGCNIENQGIQSCCAERTAFIKALSEGKKNFKKIAVVAKRENGKYILTTPCGYCRQFMSEFCKKDFIILGYDEEKDVIVEHTLEELLPYNFDI